MKTRNLKIRRTDLGFTLVELLVVVLIIGILAAIGIPQYFKVVERSRLGEVFDNAGTVISAQERYNARYGDYDTDTMQDFDIVIPNSGNGSVAGSPTGSFSGTVGILKDYSLVLSQGVGGTGGYTLTYTRLNDENGRYGNYSVVYAGCGNGQACDGVVKGNANVEGDLQ